VAASTQNQALAAILFLYKDVLASDPGWLDDVVRAERPQRLPTVLTRPEVDAMLAALDAVQSIMAMVLYGSGASPDGVLAPSAVLQGKPRSRGPLGRLNAALTKLGSDARSPRLLSNHGA
jgi:hypothetical protein